MGLVMPTGGSILWNGEDVTGLSITERARRGISYGFQQPPRFKGIRVKDLLTIASGQKFLPRGEACKYLTQVGLCAADYLDREVDASPLRRRGQAHRDRHDPRAAAAAHDPRRARGGHRSLEFRAPYGNV